MLLTGAFRAGADDSVSIRIATQQTLSFSLTEFLDFEGWSGSLSYETPETRAHLAAAGTVVIGGEGGFAAVATAEIDVVDKELRIDVAHDGDWQVKATRDGGPWTKPGASESLV